MTGTGAAAVGFAVMLLLIGLRMPVGLAMLVTGSAGYIYFSGLGAFLNYIKTTPYFLFANYTSPRLAGWIGLVFIIGRWVYARSYVADPAARGPGFIIGFSANAVLVVGALLGAIF